MNIGMLWFDNDPKTDLSTKIDRAKTYYRTKYGKTPNLCFVHPSMIPAPVEGEEQPEKLTTGDIEIRGNRSVLPNHFWIGVNHE